MKNCKSDLYIEQINENYASSITAAASCERRKTARHGFNIIEGDLPHGGKTYKTVISGEIWKKDAKEKKRLILALSEIISEYADNARIVLAAGIGNRFVPPDCLGPLTCSKLITGTIPDDSNERSECEIRLSAITPGTPAQTGIDTSRLVSLAAESEKSDAVIMIDSLCARSPARLGTVIQISDAGLTPGSALRHTSSEISSATMPCKIISIGVPTVIPADLSESDGEDDRTALLTLAEIDYVCKTYAAIIAQSVNRAVILREI